MAKAMGGLDWVEDGISTAESFALGKLAKDFRGVYRDWGMRAALEGRIWVGTVDLPSRPVILVVSYAKESDRDIVIEALRAGLPDLEQLLGVDYPWPALVVNAWSHRTTRGGGGLVSFGIGSGSLTMERSATLFHEVAHSWWPQRLPGGTHNSPISFYEGVAEFASYLIFYDIYYHDRRERQMDGRYTGLIIYPLQREGMDQSRLVDAPTTIWRDGAVDPDLERIYWISNYVLSFGFFVELYRALGSDAFSRACASLYDTAHDHTITWGEIENASIEAASAGAREGVRKVFTRRVRKQ